MRTSAIALLACASALVSTAPALAAVTYSSGATSVGSSGSYTLSLTTDGTFGSLNSGNITDFSINISDVGGSLTLTPGNAGFLIGGGLSATDTGLFFDYSSGGYALFQNPSPGSGQNFLCFASLICGGYSGATNLLVGSDYSTVSTTAYQGTVQIGSVNGAVPEPATWAMMLLGFGGIGLAVRRRNPVLARA